MLSGWGRLALPGREVFAEDLERATENAVLCRGLGRSYGDSSLPPPSHPEVVASPLADRIRSFDPRTGRIRAEAGLSLAELNRLYLRRGWFTPVSPGTQYVTLGGMVAADVHGKNHHQRGCFGDHVECLRMRVADGRILECSRDRHPDLFRATIGGMGLTGHLLEVQFRLDAISSPWIWCESERILDIEDFIRGLKRAGPDWPYTVGWIDCISRGRNMGRGILQKGRWAHEFHAPRRPPGFKRRLSVPFEFPDWVLGPLTVKAFNSAYYWKHLSRERRGFVHPESFFYPLDVVRHWNLIYGSRGFTQYQCVLPESAGPGGARRFLELLTRLGGASFLCVIKDCGPEGYGLLSFPKPGISIALDIAVRDNTQALVDALNELVLEEGGRIYLAKDAFTRPEHFRAMEPRLEEWLEIRRRWDPERRLRSAQSVRLLGDPE
jgi:FAD/FMN-containing dehydrogenase